MSEIELIFQELLFGEGAFITFIFLSSIMVLVTAKEKFLGLIFLIVSFMLSLICFNGIASDSNLMWVAILYSVTDVILALVMLRDGF